MPFQTDADNTAQASWNLWDTRFPDGQGIYSLETDGTGIEYCVTYNNNPYDPADN